MSRFGRHFRTISGLVGGFSIGTASVLLFQQFDKPTAVTASATTATQTDQLFTFTDRPWEEQVVSRKGFERHGTSYDAAVQASRELVLQTKEELGIPGLCVAVNVDGHTVWTEGFGFADVENCVPCTSKTVMRIASISKSITMAALAKLWENGKIDLDLPVQHYVPNFPSKIFEGEAVDITTRMLVSHLSGIRHWKGGEEREPATESSTKPEFYLNTHFKSVEDALSIFQNDDLLHRPGSKYLYSSPAWTLVSVVMEKAAGTSFRQILINMFNQLGLRNTRLDENECITPNRARYYIRNKTGRLINSPCVDNSCKWAGGGLQSTVGDLVKFADAMLYCHQGGSSGYLKKDTIDALWTVSPNTLQLPKGIRPIGGYGMGWFVDPALALCGGVEPQSFSVNHTGGAVGASSVLLIMPKPSNGNLPSGVTVAITVNLQGIYLTRLATHIATEFWSSKTGEAVPT